MGALAYQAQDSAPRCQGQNAANLDWLLCKWLDG